MRKIKLLNEYSQESGNIGYYLEEGEFNEYNEPIYFFLNRYYHPNGHGLAYFKFKDKGYLVEGDNTMINFMPQGPIQIHIKLEGELYQKYYNKAQEIGNIWKESDYEISSFSEYLEEFKKENDL
jgi:hypothetical protein